MFLRNMKFTDGRTGRIDLVARKNKFMVTVEYDHHSLIKWKSFQRIVQIKPEVAIAIVGNGSLEPNIKRAKKYLKHLNSDLYVLSLKQKRCCKGDSVCGHNKHNTVLTG